MLRLTSLSLIIVILNLYFATNFSHAQDGKTAEQKRMQQLLEWEAPLEVQQKYPYFLSGYDKEGSPVWVIQYGKWDVRHAVEEGDKLSKELEKWTEQMWERISASPDLVNKTGEENEGQYQYSGIADLDGYDLRSLTHVQTVQKHLTLVKQFATVVNKKGNFKKAIVINSNFLFQTLWNLIKPLLGGITNSIELYGTNSDTWKPILLRAMDKDQLPEWLGGVKKGPFTTFVQKVGYIFFGNISNDNYTEMGNIAEIFLF